MRTECPCGAMRISWCSTSSCLFTIPRSPPATSQFIPSQSIPVTVQTMGPRSGEFPGEEPRSVFLPVFGGLPPIPRNLPCIPRRSRWPCASTQSGPTLAPGTWFWTTAAVPAVSRPPQPWRAGDTSGWTTGSVRRREAPTSAGPGPKLPRNELPHCWMLPEILFGRIAYNDSIF